jgi:FtsP/CotA-like multicopper oxidase with cupredoxin domain
MFGGNDDHYPRRTVLLAATLVLLVAAAPAVHAGAGTPEGPEPASAPAGASGQAPANDGAPTGDQPSAGVADGGQTGVEPGDEVCTFEKPAWREAQSVAGVRIQQSRACRPDNPFLVAAVTKGTNDVPGEVLRTSGLAEDAVRKHTDRDGDGDPDVVEITLELHGLNEAGGGAPGHAIAPGVRPSFWVFAPKTRGMVANGTAAAGVIRMPSPPIRVEAGDTVRVILENTHYLPHTIHLHGVDHPYQVNGSGNDGVPQTSEHPVAPGDERTYEFTPRQPGTMFYHCHVTPGVHVTMGLNGMFVVTEDRPDNLVQTINVGAGKVRHPSKAVREAYDGTYDLHYQDLDAELHRIPQRFDDPRMVAKATNRVYDRTDADADYFLLNGRSFPYTVRESQVIVEPDSRYRLRVLNGGSRTVSLHTHGHKFTVEAYDGVELSESSEITRDVATISAAQRVDLTLNTTDDGLHSYGDGVWFFHDHREEAVTTDGIGPGGSVTTITYAAYLDDEGVPETSTNLSRYFSAAFYRGEEPKWDDLEGADLGEPNGTATPTVAADGHRHGHGDDDATASRGNDGATASLPAGHVVSPRTGHVVLLAATLVLGLAVGLVVGRDLL